jgi:hypothetical protein
MWSFSLGLAVLSGACNLGCAETHLVGKPVCLSLLSGVKQSGAQSCCAVSIFLVVKQGVAVIGLIHFFERVILGNCSL